MTCCIVSPSGPWCFIALSIAPSAKAETVPLAEVSEIITHEGAKAILLSRHGRLENYLKSLQRTGEIFNDECGGQVEKGTSAYTDCEIRYLELQAYIEAFNDTAREFNEAVEDAKRLDEAEKVAAFVKVFGWQNETLETSRTKVHPEFGDPIAMKMLEYKAAYEEQRTIISQKEREVEEERERAREREMRALRLSLSAPTSRPSTQPEKARRKLLLPLSMLAMVLAVLLLAAKGGVELYEDIVREESPKPNKVKPEPTRVIYDKYLKCFVRVPESYKR